MSEDRPDPRDGDPDEVACVRCLEVQDQMFLDRLLWCDRCCSVARNRAGWWGWLGGWIFGAALVAYIWIFVRPSSLVIGGWFGTVAMGIWFAAKACRELVYGVIRLQNVPAVDAEADQPPPVPFRAGGVIFPSPNSDSEGPPDTHGKA